MAGEGRIRRVIDAILRREGGYSNDPLDRGGRTRYGITERIVAQDPSQARFALGWARRLSEFSTAPEVQT